MLIKRLTTNKMKGAANERNAFLLLIQCNLLILCVYCKMLIYSLPEFHNIYGRED